MSVLTSRPSTAPVDVRDLVEDTGAEIHIIDNTTIDPPIFSLSLVQANQKQIPLLLKAGDQILITEMEHHANIVPWQIVAEEKGAQVIAAMAEIGVDLGEEYPKPLTDLMEPSIAQLAGQLAATKL